MSVLGEDTNNGEKMEVVPGNCCRAMIPFTKTAMDNFSSLLSAIGKDLKANGFSKKGNSFYLFRHGNYGIINFQKSQGSTKEKVVFTINAGVSSSAIRTFEMPSQADKTPVTGDCHWQQRVGFLLPVKDDYWWHIENYMSINDLTKEIRDIIADIVLPEIEAHISDDSLIAEWIAGKSSGITDFSRYVYLTTLLKIKNDLRLSAVVDEFLMCFKGKPIEHSARVHVEDLESIG